MYKRILVPLDGSHRAEAILPHAEELARCGEGMLIFVSIIEPPPVIMDSYEAMITLQMDEIRLREEAARVYLKARLDAMEAQKIEAKAHIAHGPVVEGIINLAVKENVDLIAMASHGRSGLGRVFYGSVAAGVLQRIDRPLLVIRAGDEA
jgi:nucleotide-binding universal stress UspA family protein